MKLHTLKLTNFRQHVRTEIRFESGLTGIIGPNGAGKTTILEAIAWALYGVPAIRGNRDSIRFIGAGARVATPRKEGATCALEIEANARITVAKQTVFIRVQCGSMQHNRGQVGQSKT